MIQIGIDPQQVKRLEASLGNKAKRLPSEIRTAINQTAKKVASETAKDLTTIMPLKQATLKRIVKQRAQATPERLRSVVRIGVGYPIPLRMFGARRTKKNGVAVRMDRRIKGKAGRKFLPNAFILDRYRGNVFERVGTARGPIQKQVGPAPGDYFAELGTEKKAYAIAAEDLPKRIEKRIRDNIEGFVKR